MKFFYVAAFGVLGVLSRYGVGILASKLAFPSFPYGTFFVNITGAFLIGVVYALATERAILPADLATGIMVGFLGGYTTFSSYCLDTVHLINQSQYLLAGIYFFLSPCLGFLAAVGGILAVR